MPYLDQELLNNIHARAAQYDQENAFPKKDYEELKAAGYYAAFAPKEYGGGGLSLAEISKEQTDLATAAPGTALGINMHQIIIGVARHLVKNGQKEAESIFKDAVNGELFGFGISEPNNDLVLMGSVCTAKPEESGDYLIYGEKIFTSLAEDWTRLLTFGTQVKTPEGRKSIYGIAHRSDGGFTTKPDWNALGMRATQSNSMTLDGLRLRKENILGKISQGPSLSPIFFGIFSNFEILLAATYAGIGKRAIVCATEVVKNRFSVANQAPYSNDADIRWRLAEAAIIMDGIYPQIESLANEIDSLQGEPSAILMPRLSALKNRAVEASKLAVEQCIRACGGRSYYQDHELSRLYRDVLAGLFQPSDQESLHKAWAMTLLGPPKE